MIARRELQNYLSELLSTDDFCDYAPNGLQIEGQHEIHSIVTGVTACQALVDAAIAEQADALLVHHGYFWKGESASIVGMKYRRVKALLEHQINLFAYHLPLDANEHYGNNAQLAARLDFAVTAKHQVDGVQNLVWEGTLAEPIRGDVLCQRIEQQLNRAPLHIASDQMIHRIAWCSGGAQNFIEFAYDLGVDAYLTGEVSEQTVHFARENHLHFFAAGHHATERYGIQSLGEHLAQKFGLKHTFIDIDNPV